MGFRSLAEGCLSKFIIPEVFLSPCIPGPLGPDIGFNIPSAVLPESRASELLIGLWRAGESLLLPAAESAAPSIGRRSLCPRLLRAARSGGEERTSLRFHPAAALKSSVFVLPRSKGFSEPGHGLISEVTAVFRSALLPSAEGLRLGTVGLVPFLPARALSPLSLSLRPGKRLLLIHALLTHSSAARAAAPEILLICIALNQLIDSLEILCFVRFVDFVHPSLQHLLMVRRLYLRRRCSRLLHRSRWFLILSFRGIKNKRAD